MTSPGYIPPSAIGWFVKKQNVFLEVEATMTAEMSFAASTSLTATATRTAAMMNVSDQGSTVIGAAVPTADSLVKKRVNRVGGVSKTGNAVSSLGSDAWSVTASVPHTVPVGGVNRALIVVATARFFSFFGSNTLGSHSVVYGGMPLGLLGHAWHAGVSNVNNGSNSCSLTAVFGMLNPPTGTNTLSSTVAQNGNGSGSSGTDLIIAGASYVNVGEFGVVTTGSGWSTVPRVTTAADGDIVGDGAQYRTVVGIGNAEVGDGIWNFSPGSSLDYHATGEIGQMIGDAAGYSVREFTADATLANWSAVGVELIPVMS